MPRTLPGLSGARFDPAVPPPLRRAMVAGIVTMLVLSLAIPIHAVGSARQISGADAAASIIAKSQARIPELMAEQTIPGLAVALVDADQELWVEGFGHLDGLDSAEVTGDTSFSVQSMTRNDASAVGPTATAYRSTIPLSEGESTS